MVMITEAQLHKQICTYIKMKYPKALFNSDMSGVRLTMGQSVRMKSLRSSRAFPDIVIYNPRFSQSNSIIDLALFLEVKKETPYKKNGELKKDKHLEEQQDMIIKLNELGYKAQFVWSFDMAKKIIDEYLSNSL